MHSAHRWPERSRTGVRIDVHPEEKGWTERIEIRFGHDLHNHDSRDDAVIRVELPTRIQWVELEYR